MNKELFSIIITNYNQEYVIFDALDSVMKQTYKNIEILITDDASDIFPTKALKEYFSKNKFNKYSFLKNKTNIGTVKTVHNAISKCKGKYILMFAADDALYNNRIIENYAKEFENNEYDIVSSKCIFCDSNLKNEGFNFPNSDEIININKISAKEQHDLIMVGPITAPGATAFRAELLKNDRYLKNEKYKYVEDWPLFLKLTKDGNKIHVINKNGLKHRAGGISDSTRSNDSLKKELLDDYDKIYMNEIFPEMFKSKTANKREILRLYQIHNDQFGKIKCKRMNFFVFVIRTLMKLKHYLLNISNILSFVILIAFLLCFKNNFILSAILSPIIFLLLMTYFKKIFAIIKNNKKCSKINISDKAFIFNLIEKQSMNLLNKEILRLENLKQGDCNYRTCTDSQYRTLEYLKILKKLKFNFLITKILKIVIKIKSEKKIKIVFLVNEYQTFSMVKSIYNTAKEKEIYEAILVHVPFYHINKKEQLEDIEINDYNLKGYYPLFSYQFDLIKASPDVVIYLKPYDTIPPKFNPIELKKYVRTICYVPYGMEILNAKESIRYQYQLPLHSIADLICSYGVGHYELSKKYSKLKGKNFYPIGHPRFDLVNVDYTSNSYYKKLKRMAGDKKIVLWNTHFSIGPGDNYGTFLNYGKDILDYFANNDNMFLLWRPHPLFYAEYERRVSEEDKLFISKLMEKSTNIFIDKNPDYLISFNASDAMISDAASFIPEYILYNKPIIYTKKENCSGMFDKVLESRLNIISKKSEINQKLYMLENKKIPSEIAVADILYYDPNVKVSQKVLECIEKLVYNKH